MSAPEGAGVMGPLTTLVDQAMTLGYSPTEASLLIKAALGIDAGINLATYDFYGALVADENDATAIAFGKVAGMVAMTASVSDPSGLSLALAVLSAAEQGGSLDLTNAADLALAGLDAAAIELAQGLNQDMVDAQTFAKMESVWDDWAKQQDDLKPLVKHFDVLSVDLNLAPTGFSDAQYTVSAGDSLTLSNADLIFGFTDPDGDELTAVNMEVDQGGTVSLNADGSWTFTPAQGYSGPVELSYLVSDGLASAKVTALLIVEGSASPPPTNSAPTGEVSISGLAEEDQTLTAANTLDDADGMGSVAYQWYADGVAIEGASSDSYTLTAADVGTAISVAASYTDGAGNAESVASVATAPVLHVNHAVAGEVTITGTAEQNQTLTASHTLTDADGLGDVVYQWFADGVAVAGASGSSYTLSQGDVNKAISVQASYTDAFGSDESMNSLATAIVANVNDAPVGGVSIAGTAQQGQTLTASNTLTDIDGLGTIGYQWRANGVAIAGAAGSSYVLTAADVGKTISVLASYVDGFGTAENVASSATAAVAALTGVTLTGGSKADVLTGTAGADRLSGLGGNDTLTGLAGLDLLTGGAGNDKMDGGQDGDLYLIEKSGEHTSAEVADSGTAGSDELRFASTGKDSLTLYAGDTGIERVVIGTGTAATAVTSATTAINVNASAVKNGLALIGNAGTNALTGTAFADLLDGGAGVDTLTGGAGSDTYVVDLTAAGALQDTVTDSGADAGDTLVLRGVSSNATAVTLTLAAALENLDASATGTSRLNLNGNASANSLIGNGAGNVINGNAGNDWLMGGEGADVLDGGAGNDVFAYGASTQSDRAVTDKINNIDFGGADGSSAVDRFHFDDLSITSATLLNNVSTNAMSTLQALQNTLSFMSAGQAVLMNVTSGVGVGTYLFVDANGQAGYQASGDYAIQLTGVANLANFDLSDVTA
jgi:Ca2+-binding RTX toxin-like protein